MRARHASPAALLHCPSPSDSPVGRQELLMCRKPVVALLLGACAALPLANSRGARQEPSFTRQQDVIYGREFGTALTMDVFKPKGDANGAAIIWVISGGFFSSHEAINPAAAKPLLARGYTVFAVVHGCQPRYQVPEIVQDMNRAVRYNRKRLSPI